MVRGIVWMEPERHLLGSAESSESTPAKGAFTDLYRVICPGGVKWNKKSVPSEVWNSTQMKLRSPSRLSYDYLADRIVCPFIALVTNSEFKVDFCAFIFGIARI
jgi:hypothetical protein